MTNNSFVTKLLRGKDAWSETLTGLPYTCILFGIVNSMKLSQVHRNSREWWKRIRFPSNFWSGPCIYYYVPILYTFCLRRFLMWVSLWTVSYIFFKLIRFPVDPLRLYLIANQKKNMDNKKKSGPTVAGAAATSVCRKFKRQYHRKYMKITFRIYSKVKQFGWRWPSSFWRPDRADTLAIRPAGNSDRTVQVCQTRRTNSSLSFEQPWSNLISLVARTKHECSYMNKKSIIFFYTNRRNETGRNSYWTHDMTQIKAQKRENVLPTFAQSYCWPFLRKW